MRVLIPGLVSAKNFCALTLQKQKHIIKTITLDLYISYIVTVTFSGLHISAIIGKIIN